MKAITLIDWLTFTLFDWGDSFMDVIRDVLGMNPNLFHATARGRYGYRSAVEYSNIVVYYNGREQTGGDAGERSMGICVSFSGNGCRVYEEYGHGCDLLKLCAKLLEMYDYDNRSVHFSRCDIACDDKAGNLCLQRIREYLSLRQVNTRIRRVCENKSYDLGNPQEQDAVGFYVGSPKSDFRYRFYDKAKEQGDYESQWIRVEMVNRNEYALGAVRALVEAGDEIGKCVAAMIRASLLFVEADNARVERCSVADWWNDFLETLETIRHLEKIKAKQNAEKLFFWLENQLARSLGMAKAMLGSEFLERISDEGLRRLTPSQSALVADYIHRAAEPPALGVEFAELDKTGDFVLVDGTGRGSGESACAVN
jgi:DNA relaxase NicK